MFSSKTTLTIFILVAAVIVAIASTTATATATTTIRKTVAFHNLTMLKYAHMTMIEQINETFIILMFQGSTIGEGHKNQQLFITWSYDGGVTFQQPPQVAVDGHGYAVWGPALQYDRSSSTLFLYYSQSVPANDRQGDRNFPGGDLMVVTSSDFGVTWSSNTPRLLIPYHDLDGPGHFGNVSKMTANKPVTLSQDGRAWALPCWCEPHFPSNPNDTGKQVAFLLVTTDAGLTYKTTPGHLSHDFTWLIENWAAPLAALPFNAQAASEAVPVQQGFRTQIMFMYQAVATSQNGGVFGNWTRATASDVENPDSKTSGAAIFGKGTSAAPTQFVLSCNPTYNSRNLLVLFSGQPWSATNVNWGIRFDKTQPLAVLENSTQWQSDYPTVVQSKKQGDVLVSYTCLSHAAACLARVSGVY